MNIRKTIITGHSDWCDNKTLRISKAAKDAALEVLNVWKNAKGGVFQLMIIRGIMANVNERNV